MIYISGKISGLEYSEAEKFFLEAEKALTELGHKVSNPIKNGLPKEASWKEHMLKDIEMLMGCSKIYMLSNWHDSRGARIEKNIAEEMGMAVIFQSSQAETSQRIKEVKEAIEQVTGLSFREIKKNSREHQKTYARMVFVNLLKDEFSASKLAIILGKDSAYVNRYIRNFNKELNFNNQFRNIYNKVQDVLTNSVSQ